MPSRDFRNILLLCAICSVGTACQSLTTTDGLLEREQTPPKITSDQLRVLVNEYVVYAVHRHELTADRILADNPDPAVRKCALLWKINGISACFQAASRRDPLGSYLDLWILNRQMLHFSESAQAGDLFGPWQPILLGECQALDDRLRGIGQTASSNLRLGEEFVEKFATDFPLTGLYFDREPIASRYIEEVQAPSQELFHVVASLDKNLDELRKLSILYAEHLPKQARWETELFLIDAVELGSLQSPLKDLALSADAIARMADTAQSLPLMVETERRALSALLTEERKQTLREVDRMRAATVTQLAAERAIVLAAITEERQAAFASLSQEREAVTAELHAEISRALAATDDITGNRAREILEEAPRVIDHFFWRAWQIAAVMLIAAALGLWLLRRRSARPQKAAEVRTSASHGRTESIPMRKAA
jgi:hypothetical protein